MSARRRSFGFGNVIALLIGDLVVFLLFAWLGRVEHEMTMELSEVLVSAAPFAIAWLVVGLFTGAYTARALRSAGAGALRAIQTWLIAAPWALVARSIYLGTPIILSFAAVTFGMLVVALPLWRAIYAAIASR